MTLKVTHGHHEMHVVLLEILESDLIKTLLGIQGPLPFFFTSISILGCPIARKRRLEEAEVEQEQDTERPTSKRKTHPLKLALDEGFSAESDASSEAEGEGERDKEEVVRTKTDQEVERKTAVNENKEEMTEEATQDGCINTQVVRTHKEEEERKNKVAYQKENTFTDDEGRICA